MRCPYAKGESVHTTIGRAFLFASVLLSAAEDTCLKLISGVHTGPRDIPEGVESWPPCAEAKGKSAPWKQRKDPHKSTRLGCEAWMQWAVELLLYTAALPGGSGQWNSFKTLPHCLG